MGIWDITNIYAHYHTYTFENKVIIFKTHNNNGRTLKFDEINSPSDFDFYNENTIMIDSFFFLYRLGTFTAECMYTYACVNMKWGFFFLISVFFRVSRYKRNPYKS